MENVLLILHFVKCMLLYDISKLHVYACKHVISIRDISSEAASYRDIALREKEQHTDQLSLMNRENDQTEFEGVSRCPMAVLYRYVSMTIA